MHAEIKCSRECNIKLFLTLVQVSICNFKHNNFLTNFGFLLASNFTSSAFTVVLLACLKKQDRFIIEALLGIVGDWINYIAHMTALILSSLTVQMIQGQLRIFLIAEGLSLRYRQ